VKVDKVIIDLEPSGGKLEVRVVPKYRRAEPPPLLDCRDDLEADPDLAPIQLLEATDYLYSFDSNASIIITDRPEVFEADDDTGHKGRLRTGLSVGTLPVAVTGDGTPLGRFQLEIRSRKLDYASVDTQIRPLIDT